MPTERSAPAPRSLDALLPAGAWACLAGLGGLLFVVGAWMAFQGSTYSEYLQWSLDIVGAVLFVLGVTMAVRAREGERRRVDQRERLLHEPGIEVYRPGAPPQRPNAAPRG